MDWSKFCSRKEYRERAAGVLKVDVLRTDETSE